MPSENDHEASEAETHQVRITAHTKIQAYVKFCLKYLTDKPGAILVLHTLPNAKEDKAVEEPLAKRRKLATPIESIPKLITIAEIVKREFTSLVATNKAGGGNPAGTVLHQYNALGQLPSTPGDQDEVLLALEGKHYLKRTSTPYMKVWLTTQKRDDLETSRATYQSPSEPPRKSKSARARERRRRLREPVEKVIATSAD